MDGPESVAQVGPFARRYNLTFPMLLDEETARGQRLQSQARGADDGAHRQAREVARVRNGYNAGDEKLVAEDVANLVK